MPNDDVFAEFDQAEADYGYTEAQQPQPQTPAPQAPVQPQAPPPVPQGDPQLEALLRMVAGQTEGQPEQPQAQQPAAPAPGPVPYDRFQQMAEENRYLRELVTRSLGGQGAPGQGQPVQAGGESEVPEGVDPDIYAYVKPILEAERAKMMGDLAPVLEKVQREQAIEALTQTVPGFQPEMVDELEREYASMSPQQQNEYRGRGGAEAIAFRVVMRRLQAQPTATSPGAPVRSAARAHSISRSGGMLPPVQRPINVNDLTEEGFEALKQASMARRYGAQSWDEPDPILDGRF
ncbi:MAG: hypothetical protein IPO08_20020 [Xanthomonadales bacterium]|nr:hypothetical protein [Xanthomonadales bacterium]